MPTMHIHRLSLIFGVNQAWSVQFTISLYWSKGLQWEEFMIIALCVKLWLVHWTSNIASNQSLCCCHSNTVCFNGLLMMSCRARSRGAGETMAGLPRSGGCQVKCLNAQTLIGTLFVCCCYGICMWIILLMHWKYVWIFLYKLIYIIWIILVYLNKIGKDIDA